jgi:hypothetical protein
MRPRLRIGCALVDGRVSPEEVLSAGRPTQPVRRAALALAAQAAPPDSGRRRAREQRLLS